MNRFTMTNHIEMTTSVFSERYLNTQRPATKDAPAKIENPKSGEDFR